MRRKERGFYNIFSTDHLRLHLHFAKYKIYSFRRDWSNLSNLSLSSLSSSFFWWNNVMTSSSTASICRCNARLRLPSAISASRNRILKQTVLFVLKYVVWLQHLVDYVVIDLSYQANIERLTLICFPTAVLEYRMDPFLLRFETDFLSFWTDANRNNGEGVKPIELEFLNRRARENFESRSQLSCERMS